MNVRRIGISVAAVLLAAGLAGCRSHVGNAAVVDGQRISESDVSGYVTPNAKPIQLQETSGATYEAAPKSFVLQTLIYTRLLEELIAKVPNRPTPGQLAAAEATTLGGKTASQYAEANGITGYTAAFDSLLVHRSTLTAVLQEASQRGVNVQSLFDKSRFEVRVNPRYGSWDAKNKVFESTPGAGVPGFVQLQPTAGAQSGAAQ